MSSAWALSAFSLDYDLVKFTGLCIEKEADNIKRQYIFNSLISGYRQQGITGDTWNHIDKLAKKYGLYHEALNDLDTLIGEIKDDRALPSVKARTQHDENNKNNEELYGDIDFFSDAGLREALERFEAVEGIRDFEGLWKYAASKVSGANATKYLSLIANFEYLNLYDIQHAIKYFPDSLKKKPAVKKAWPNIVKTIAGRFPEDFTRCYRRDWVLKDIGTDEVTVNAVREGVFRGLAESNGLESASTFYGFAGSCVDETSADEAVELFDFALTRFEIHIDDEYADGLWASKLNPPEQIIKSLTGYIWVNLGSPKSSERWRAMHVVRRLYELVLRPKNFALLSGNLLST